MRIRGCADEICAVRRSCTFVWNESSTPLLVIRPAYCVVCAGDVKGGEHFMPLLFGQQLMRSYQTVPRHNPDDHIM